MKTSVIIMAAGDGKRMKSHLPKALHPAAGKPLAEWVVCAAEEATGEKPILIYGSGGTALPDYFGESCLYAHQAERRGSGHAVMMAEEYIRQCDYVVVLAGDMPLIRAEDIKKLMDVAIAGDYGALLYTGVMDTPCAFGRILRDERGYVCGIVEEKDATEAQKEIKEVNLSMYCFRSSALLEALPLLSSDNAQGEYYLTDAVQIIYEKGLPTGAINVEDMDLCEGVNSRGDLAKVSQTLRSRINARIMEGGVTLIDPQSTYIDADVEVGSDTVIYPGVILEAGTKVGCGATLYQGSRIRSSTIGDGATVQNSVIEESRVGAGAQIGPYAWLRPGSDVGDRCRIGDFVEVKNSVLGEGTKVSHLTYVGDSDLGRDINVGCGVVFVNYDGQKKARSTVGDGAFIGCNTNLISPVHVGEGAYIAAGGTVTKDIPDDALVIARAREVIKSGWAKGRYKGSPSARK